MPRSGPVPKRPFVPDVRYKDDVCGYFINVIMQCGKKYAAERVFYGAMDYISGKGGDPLEVFHLAVENVGPTVEVRPQPVGGVVYQIPRDVHQRRRISLAAMWIRDASRNKKGAPMHIALGEEIWLASRKEGAAFKKHENVNAMAKSSIGMVRGS